MVAPDRALLPREILSPAVGRNGHATFHVAVSVPQGQNYLLYVVTNPIDACRVSMYREHFIKTAQGWIPDKLVELTRLPEFGVVPDPDEQIEGQTTRLYLLDIWIPPDAHPGRFRLEVQLKMGDWTIRPLEVRVGQALYPDLPAKPGAVRLPAPDAAADAFALLALRESAPAPPDKTCAPSSIATGFRMWPLDRSLEGNLLTRALNLWRFNSMFTPRPWGAEWYLKLRDSLLNR